MAEGAASTVTPLTHLHSWQVGHQHWQVRGYNAYGQAVVIVNNLTTDQQAQAVIVEFLRRWARDQITGLDMEILRGK